MRYGVRESARKGSFGCHRANGRAGRAQRPVYGRWQKTNTRAVYRPTGGGIPGDEAHRQRSRNLAQNGIDRADFDPTLATLREGVVNVALDRATEEVDGWERRLRAADDRELTPVADNLAALRTELQREPLDGVTLGHLMQDLASQVAHLSGEGTEAESAAPIAAKLEELAKLLYAEGNSLGQP